MSDLRTIREIARSVHAREVSAVEVTRSYLDRIERANPSLNAFIEVLDSHALEAAREVDARLDRSEQVGPLAGVPIAVKDNIATAVGKTTCGSRMLADYRSPFTATAVQKLIHQGAIIIGKTNCDEFAMGSSTENSAFGPTRNPHDPSRVPGGSSGGSAAAVAANLSPGALGSETGGSVRQPASMCGIVGVKPSYGRVSRYGLVAFGSSLDQIAPFAHNVTDAAMLLHAMSGADPLDSTSSDKAVASIDGIDQPIDGLRVGLPRQYLSASNDASVNAAVEDACRIYEQLGATIVDINLPLTEYGIAVYYVLAPAEASSNLARFDGIRYGRRAKLEAGEELFDLYAKSRAEGFGKEVQRRIMLGTYVLSSGYYDAYYKRALQVRRLIRREYDEAFKNCHVLIGPTSPTPAFPIGAKSDPLTMYLSDVYTVNTNIAGICAISLPCGIARADGHALPIGLQLQAQAFDEATMFRAARMFERAFAAA